MNNETRIIEFTLRRMQEAPSVGIVLAELRMLKAAIEAAPDQKDMIVYCCTREDRDAQ